MKFKIGDKVKLRNNLIVGKIYGCLEFLDIMEYLKDKTMVVQKVCDYDNNYHIEENQPYWYSGEMLELAKEVKTEDIIEKNDQLVQYFIVNSELNMSPGKIAGQVAHMADDIAESMHIFSYESRYLSNQKYQQYKQWKTEFNKKKIILKAKQKKLEELVSQGFYYIRDNGLTEISEGSLTCVGLGVMWKSEAQQYIKRLQLL